MDYSYKVGDEVVRLEVDPSVVAVKFADVSRSMASKAADRAGVGPFRPDYDIVGDGFALVPALGPQGYSALSPEAMISLKLEGLRAEDAVNDARPVFRLGQMRAIATDEIVIGFDPEADPSDLIDRYQLAEISRADERLIARVPAGANVFDLVHAVEGEKDVLYAEPQLVLIGSGRPDRMDVSRPIYALNAASSRYAMRITKAEDAWQVQQGNPAIVVAILDEGVDTHHPDLAPAVVGTYDAVEKDSYQEPNSWDGHGTACAGLAVAKPAAPGGMSGSGRGCSLLAVRIAFSRRPEAPWETTPAIIAEGIDWAWRNGAAVISNSWGQAFPSNPILAAMERARLQGRDGLGAVVVAAAGNNEGTVNFPGSMAQLLTVAASNEFDECKTSTSADGEDWWGSCFGPQVDVAAPGVHNLTTDISAGGGYSTGNYAPAFNGTSSSTPIVAGACALILSRRPGLREDEVRQIIMQTTEKVGQFPYLGGRNDRMGFGRLNVLAALQLS